MSELSKKVYRIAEIVDCYPSPWINEKGNEILQKGEKPRHLYIKWCKMDDVTKVYSDKT
jgi:hypothetical protein